MSMTFNYNSCVVQSRYTRRPGGNCREVRRRMALHLLKLNDEKTKMMIFTSEHHLKTYEGYSLTIGDDTVSPSDRIMYLGVHKDQHLTMTDHVTAVCAACNYHLYRLSSIQHYLTNEAAKSTVTGLVTSRLDYCNSLLHTIPLSQTARLQRVQNNAARIITRTSKHDHITVLNELQWLPVESRIVIKTLVMTFKCINGLAPSYLAEITQPRKRDGRLRQNYAPTLHQGITKKCIGDSAFGARMFTGNSVVEQLWN
ncbi:hypothetical protein NP493_790g00006 [Ridgeia piscesae]|uniref:Uncharacterized protein n=1 Tax=Ridgeia piscesae TaxID=27915 RepID=A0AAD9KN25_RIDPI|nr:hypothetical protein NP493_790g00006 [Ridgeia piscesae]